MPELIECQVCLTELLESNNTILHFKCCLQSSHKECFLKWLSYRGIKVTCPVCRSDIISNNLIKSLISTNDILDYIKIDKSNEKRLQDVLRQVYKLPIKEPYFNDTMYTMFLKFLFIFSIVVFVISLILLINIFSGKVN
jgi:hypothetical protein